MRDYFKRQGSFNCLKIVLFFNLYFYPFFRRIIGAQMQMVTYKEFIPLVIGNKRMNSFNLNVQSSGYTKYNSEANPSIYTEFASAAFRFGHTLISPVYTRMLPNGAQTEYWLKDNR